MAQPTSIVSSYVSLSNNLFSTAQSTSYWIWELFSNISHHSSHGLLTDPVLPGLFYKQPCHSLIDWVSQSFPSNLHNIINHKQWELGGWNFESMFTPQHTTCHVSHVMCHVSCVMCHLSCITCHVSHVTFFLLLFWTKWWSLSVDGLFSTGPSPSSFYCDSTF